MNDIIGLYFCVFQPYLHRIKMEPMGLRLALLFVLVPLAHMQKSNKDEQYNAH
jgi:hypothetical protein